jgi:STE24 endopeptidase
MTATSVRVPVGASRRRAGHFGAWRALTAVPAMVGSLLLLVLFGWLGEWEGAVLLGWIGFGAAVFTRVGERVAVRVGAGFRRPTKAEVALVAPAWTSALARAGLAAGEVDLYVQRSREPNAFAAGGRSVAVTTGVLAKFQARRLGEEYLVAVLTHELGHHATRATKFALVTMWLALPWRFASRLVIGIGLSTVGRRQPLRLLAVVVLAGVVVAVVQAVQQRHWAVAAVLSAVAACTVLCPLADAAVSRRSEYAADRYAADVGVGRQLAGALQVLAGRQPRRVGLVARLLSRHPQVSRRIEALGGVPGRV